MTHQWATLTIYSLCFPCDNGCPLGDSVLSIYSVFLLLRSQLFTPPTPVTPLIHQYSYPRASLTFYLEAEAHTPAREAVKLRNLLAHYASGCESSDNVLITISIEIK